MRAVSRNAFSLIELMVAIIILGFGLLMIGAVLPIAWKSSIRASELTRADGAYTAAKFHVLGKARVDGNRDLYDFTSNYSPMVPPDGVPDDQDPSNPQISDFISYSFLGDLDTLDLLDSNFNGMPDTDGPDDTQGNPIVIPRVHALHMENWAVDSQSDFLLSSPGVDFSVPEAPILIQFYASTLPARSVGTPADIAPLAGFPAPSIIGKPIVALSDRLFPPMPDAITPADVDQWQDQLRDRQYIWSVFHHLLTVPETPNEPRTFMMYFVTLRRGQSGSRYARQDHNSLPLGSPGSGGSPPLALKEADDVRFPIAWRVPLLTIETERGVPATAYAGFDAEEDTNLLPAVNPPINTAQLYDVDNSRAKIADMFPVGTFFIDELNGGLYRVTQRDYLDPDGNLARLALDKEVTVVDLEGEDSTPLILENAAARNRVVWVFPPALSPGPDRDNDGDPVRFAGPTPVVEVHQEPLVLYP